MKRFGPVLLSLGIFGGAIWILGHELKKYPLGEIRSDIMRIPFWRIFGAATLTLSCYGIVTFYDWLAFKYVGRKISHGRVIFAAFIAYAVGNNVGLANFGGTATRARIYSKWGISGKVIAEVVALDTLANWIGFLLAPGLLFTIFPPPLPKRLSLPFPNARPIGVIFLILVVGYAVFAAWKRRPIHFFRWKLPVPRNRLFALQVLVACGDLAFGGFVLRLLLPHIPGLSLLPFLGVFLLAQTAGLLSHVPGGLGVFETMILFSLEGTIGGSTVLGALVAYRAIYYLFPIVIALVLFAAFEWRYRHRSTAKRSHARNRSAP